MRASVDVDRYRPIRQLGKGGMGVVDEVEDSKTGARLARKTMLEPDARSLLRFKREFRVMAELRHPNLVRLYDLGFANDAWYFTMELVDGADLLQATVTAPAGELPSSTPPRASPARTPSIRCTPTPCGTRPRPTPAAPPAPTSTSACATRARW